MKNNEVQDFAGEIQTGRAPRPRWLANLGYFLVILDLAYFVGTASDGGLDGPNTVFAVLLVMWLIYTPIAVRKKWFAIRL